MYSAAALDPIYNAFLGAIREAVATDHPVPAQLVIATEVEGVLRPLDTLFFPEFGPREKRVCLFTTRELLRKGLADCVLFIVEAWTSTYEPEAIPDPLPKPQDDPNRGECFMFLFYERDGVQAAHCRINRATKTVDKDKITGGLWGGALVDDVLPRGTTH